MKHPGTSGGYSDKKGNQYELIWAVEYALKCIQDERRSITYEDLDPDLAEGSEFTYVDEHDSTHVFQVKRLALGIVADDDVAVFFGRFEPSLIAHHVLEGHIALLAKRTWRGLNAVSYTHL